MDRLSGLDNSFLRLETESAHMHVGWLAEVDLADGATALDAGAVATRFGQRLHAAPRFRQVVRPAPIGEPYWADDQRFSLGRHVTVASEAADELSAAELDEVSGEFFSRQLGRSRPLWQVAVVERLEGNRAAILGKVHHAMVDGVAAVELGMMLFDLAADAAQPEAIDWEPEPAAGAVRTALDSVGDSAIEQFRAARRVAALGLKPRSTLRVVETMRRAALRLAEDVITPAPGSYLNKPIGPDRALVTTRLTMQRLDRLKHALDVKLNDVVLAIVAGTLRRFASHDDGEAGPLRVMVPVSVRSADEAGGNRIAFAFIDLPVEEPDPLRRVAAIRAQTLEFKDSGRIEGSEALQEAIGRLPGFVQERAARLAASPRMYNLTVSNVPGPRLPLYAAGSRVRTIYPVIPLSDGHAISIGVLTYCGGVHFSAYADPGVLPAVRELRSLVLAATRELERASGSRDEARSIPVHGTAA